MNTTHHTTSWAKGGPKDPTSEAWANFELVKTKYKTPYGLRGYTHYMSRKLGRVTS